METEDRKPLPHTQILEEAAEWLIETSSGSLDAAGRQTFDTWLRTSPEHVRAYLELLPAWEHGASVPLAPASPEDLIARARQSADVVAITDKSPASSIGARRPAAPLGGAVRRQKWLAIAATILIAIGAYAGWHQFLRGVHSTGIGEQRFITLDDGSSIELNSRSRVRVVFTARGRNVELVHGQALFRIATDKDRPFTVRTNATRVRAVGTQFDVNRKRSGTVVTVLEGRVAVVPRAEEEGSAVTTPPEASGAAGALAAAASSSVLLSAGEQLTVAYDTRAAAVPPRPTRANIAAATAWTQRRLVFDASTLADVVEEFNRHNKRRLILRDSSLESFPITAAFSSTAPDSLIRFLETQPGIVVTQTPDEIEISMRE